MNYYPNYNQFYPQPMQQQRVQPVEPQYPQYVQPQFTKPTGLQGKSVDSIDVVKAMDIPLDGTISFFPLTDGSAIVTKQLQADGSSKTVVYKPATEEEVGKLPKYVTNEELQEAIKKVDISAFKDDIKNIRRQLKDLTNDIEDLRKD